MDDVSNATKNNELYIFGDIDSEMCLDSVEELNEMNPEKKITIYIVNLCFK